MRSVKPIYFGSKGLEKPNYNKGFIGFSYNDENLFSYGITLFTKEESDKIVVSHAFLVVDSNTIAEAVVGGVQLSPISKYFDNPHYAVFFKKPKRLTEEISDQLTAVAKSKVGMGYDYGLIIHFFLRKFFLYKWISESSYFRMQPSLFDSKGEEVCSEYVCDILNSEAYYRSLFPLNTYHPSKIDPLRLFRSDDEHGVFEPWKFEDTT